MDPTGVSGNPGAGTPPAALAPEPASPEPAGSYTTPASMTVSHRLAVTGACAALTVTVTVVAALEPNPGRHVRGLLLVVALVLALGVFSAWVRVVRALRPSGIASDIASDVE